MQEQTRLSNAYPPKTRCRFENRVSHQKIEHVLIEKTLFVPLTDAVVVANVSRKKWYVPFLAVNKDQILSLFEQSTATYKINVRTGI